MTLIAFAVAILPYVFVGLRLFNALTKIFPDRRKRIRRALSGVFIYLNLLPVIVLAYYITGNGQEFTLQSEFSITDILFVFPFWIGFLAIFELFFYFLAIEAVQILLKLFADSLWLKWQKIFAYTRISLFIFFFIFVLFRAYLDTYTIQTNKFSVTPQDLPAEFDGLKLALVADLQVDRFTQEKKIGQFYYQLDQIKPDLLFFAGDLVTRGTNFIDQGTKTLCNINAAVGRIACIGDHDVWADAGRIANGLHECGWNFLNDQHSIYNYRGKRILVTGITYVYSRRIPAEKLDRLLASAPTADLKILLVHQPAKTVIDAAAKHGYDIMLAGHTHGGQIIFRPFGFTLTPTMFENSDYNGYHQVQKTAIFITNGIGLTMMPLRFRASAEIQQITLRAIGKID